MKTKTQKGDMYNLDDIIMIYDDYGVALKFNKNLLNGKGDYVDSNFRKFSLTFDKNSAIFYLKSGETINVPLWLYNLEYD